MKRKLALILVLILAVTAVYAAPLQSHFIQKFLGLNSKLSERLIGEEESPDLSNFTLEQTGALKERDVFSEYNSVPGALGLNSVNGLFKYYQTANKFFVACAGANVGSGAGGAWSDITATGNTVSANNYWSATSFVRTGDTEPTLYLFNNSVVEQKWSGTGLLNDVHESPSTNCRFSEAHKARMWASGSESLPYRLYYSSLSDPENWSATGGSLDLPNLAEAITGIKSWGGFLYIFTETSIYRLQGSTPNDFSLVKTISQVGTVAPLSIEITDIGIMFLARTGVFAFNGNTSIKTSDKIDPTINAISATNIKKAAGLYDGQKKYWLASASNESSFNDDINIYDILLKEWYPYDNLSISYFERAFGGTDKGELYGGSSLNDGMVWLLQESAGEEVTTHNTQTDFLTGTTFNTVVTTAPQVTLNTPERVRTTNTKLLLHGNDVDGSTDILDEAEHTITVTNNTKIKTDEKQLGSGSIFFDGVNDRLSTANIPDWDVVASAFDNWTIGLWIKLVSLTNAEQFIIQSVTTAPGNYWEFSKSDGGGVLFTSEVGGVAKHSLNTGTGVLTTDWTHVALCKVGSEYGIYVNGVQKAHQSTTEVGNFNGGLNIGVQMPAQASDFKGHMDEVFIEKDNVYDAQPNSGLTDTIPYREYPTSGTLTSDNLEINASDASTLGNISWLETVVSNQDIQVTTRTGSTDDTVDWADWEDWVSTSTVVYKVTGDTSGWWSSDATNFNVSETSDATQPRNVDFYEAYDELTPEAVKITTTGVIEDYIHTTIPIIDLSTYNWIGFWLKSPVSGSSVVLEFGEVSENTVDFLGQITADTVEINTWEYFYGILPSNKDAIKYLRLKQTTGNTVTSGDFYIGDVHAYDFLNSGETITSNPNDFIQYRIVEAQNNTVTSPILTSISLNYTPSAGEEEDSLESFYFTKYLDFGTPMKNKDFLDMFLEVNASTDSTATIQCDWDIDSGNQSGTLNFAVASTRSTVRIEKHFPSSTFGKAIRFKLSNDDKDNQVTIKGLEIRYREETFSN